MEQTSQSMPQKRHCPQAGLADLQRNWQQQFFRHSAQYHTANLLLEPQVNGLYILFPCGFHFGDVCPAQLSYQLQQIFFGNFLAVVNEDTAVLGAVTHPLHANFLPQQTGNAPSFFLGKGMLPQTQTEPAGAT